MIKIDFHIHTIKTDLDSSFEFSLDKISEYVQKKKINAIAITNHNLFDRANFNLIKIHLKDVAVYPGIEVTLEGGHLIVVAPFTKIEEFEEQCKKIHDEFKEKKDISLDSFMDIFSNHDEYLLIPHYYKNPKIQKFILDRIGSSFICGEVGNPKKFIRLYKEKGTLTPLLFSDKRMADDIPLSNQQTYIETDSTDFYSIKEAIRDKEKVYINEKKKRDLFPILDDGTLASSGLNIIFGKRSSGKTYTLDRINENFDNVKYIKQFDLIEKDKEAANKKFDESMSNDRSIYSDEYLAEFKEIVNDVLSINYKEQETKLRDYVSSLVEFAVDMDNHDSFSKVPVFSEQKFEYVIDKKTKSIIDSISNLLDSGTYEKIINKYISNDNLIKMLNEFVVIHREKKREELIYKQTNELIDKIQRALSIESSQNAIPSFDINQYATDVIKKNLFVKIADIIKKPKLLLENQIGKFKIVAKREPFGSAKELQNFVGKKGEYSSSYNLYDNPFDYLNSFEDKPHIPKDQIYKYFVRINYQVLNANGYPVSGGERAEFNLEKNLSDAENYDMLLIDEPESSFDNIFLRTDIVDKITSISKKIPVFVSTHNNVLGGNLNSNYILYTEAVNTADGTIFSIYGGNKENKVLTSVNNTQIKNYVVMINSLEGGEESYGERKETYKNLKD